MPPWTRACALVLTLFAAACAHFPVNEPLDEPLPKSMGYRFETLSAGVANTDSVVVCLSFSGGGTRAGAMAYGVVRALSEARIDGGTRTLLDEVDFISAASGGAFPAAYYGAFGRERFFSEFRERVLLRDVGMETFWRVALCPYHFVRMLSPWFNRSEVASELYARTIYNHRHYSDLHNRGRPFVVLNATDMLSGKRFEFTQDQFDRLGSSLSRVSLARAVASSAAFPFLLTPVAFRDNTAKEERYTHLIDGGIVDNLGLGFVIESYKRGAIHDLIAAGKVEKLVFVVVNARNHSPKDMSESPQAPGVASVLSFGLGAAIDRNADGQERQLAELCRRNAGKGPDGGPGPQVHFIDVDLEDLRNPEQRARLLAVPTTFGLEELEVDELILASGNLLRQNPAFRRLMRELR